MKTLKQYVAEGRPSQRHPLEGHDYHKKSDVELKGIAKDATEAAEAMKGHNTTAENKYRDQANDSATVRHWRRQNGMPEWYKKKYGHIKEEVDHVSESAEPGTVIAKHGDVEVHRHESDEDGSSISVRKNGKKIADGDYDRHAGAFFVSHKSFSPGQKAFDSSKAVAHHFATMKEEVDEAYTGKGNNRPGWMLRADPTLAKKIKQKKELVQKRQKAMGNPSAGISVKEEVEQITEDLMKARQLYAQTYAKNAKTILQSKDAKQKAYDAVEKKHGSSVLAQLKVHHSANEEVNQIEEESPAWQRKEGKSESGGLNRKGVESYRRENPGSKLSTAVTTEPSKLKPGSKAANRRKSFCARMGGMKKRLTSAKTANDPDSRINKSLRKWNC